VRREGPSLAAKVMAVISLQSDARPEAPPYYDFV